MDNTKFDEYLPMDCIKTHNNNEHEQELAGITEKLVSNELQLLREEDLLVEPEAETNPDDPLNKLEIKMETPEISAEFHDEHNEVEFLNVNSVPAQLLTPDTVNPSSSSRKRMRSSVTELDKLSVGEVDNVMQHKTLAPIVKLVADILDAWLSLMNETILSNILKHTNDEIKKHKSKAVDNNDQLVLDLPELSAWIGLNYLCGIFSKSGATLEELWTVELGNGIFRACMSRKRFEFISECLRLGEKPKTKKKRDFDATLQAVTEVWEQFIANCRSCYEPSANCTVHEHVIDMSCTDYPKQLGISLAAESTHCGIRIVSLHDSKTHYLCNALLGKSAAADRAEVLTLVCDINNSKRSVILTERYTSLQLAQNLLKKQLSLVGSLAPKSKDFPPEYCNPSSRQTLQRIKAGAVFSFIPQNSGSEVLLTSGISPKINAEKLYEATTHSGQCFYQSAACYSTTAIFNAVDSNSTQSLWPLRFFHAMLDFACINAWLLFRFSKLGDNAVKQRDFQRQLGIFLTQKHLKRLLYKNSKTPLQRKLLISDILGESLNNLMSEAVSAVAQGISTAGNTSWKHAKMSGRIQLLPKKTEKRRRCRVCTWRNNNLTGWQCQQCARAMCPSHLINRCQQCLGIEIKHNEKEEERDAYFK